MNNNIVTYDNKINSNNVSISSSIGNGVLNSDGTYYITIDINNPDIQVSVNNNYLMKVNLSKQQIQNGQCNIDIKYDAIKSLENMSTNEDAMSQNNDDSSLFRLYWEKNGHHYNNGVPVVCNDFNGPSNYEHVYLSKFYHFFTAYGYYKGSDCYENHSQYGCPVFESSLKDPCRGNASSDPSNCSQYSQSKGPHQNFSMKLHWRS